MSLNSFSQTDTTKVRISSPIARLAIKDLIRYDGVVLELAATQDKVVKLLQREKEKDTNIALLEQKDKNNIFIIATQRTQLQTALELSQKLNKELKGQKSKTFLYKVGTLVGIISTSYFLLK